MQLRELETLVRQGESDILEFKKSTSLLDGVAQTLCGFLNGKGGSVLIGITSDGKIVGQDVTDNTRQEIAREINKIEPTAQIEISYVPLKKIQKINFNLPGDDVQILLFWVGYVFFPLSKDHIAVAGLANFQV